MPNLIPARKSPRQTLLKLYALAGGRAPACLAQTKLSLVKIPKRIQAWKDSKTSIAMTLAICAFLRFIDFGMTFWRERGLDT
jgi:hypothetical protein